MGHWSAQNKMPALARLRVRAAPDGGWDITFEAPGLQARGALALEPLRALRVAVRGGVDVPDALGGALAASPPLLGAVARWREGAGQSGTLPVLVIDAQSFDARAMPWEQLALPGLGPLEEGGCAIARLSAEGSNDPGPEAGDLCALVWSEDPASPGAVELNATLARVTGELGLQSPATLKQGELSWVERDAALVLHLHGRASAISSALRGSTLGGDVDFAMLPSAIGRCVLVVLHPVIDAQSGEADIDHLVSDLLRAGAPAVLAVNTALDGPASFLLTRGLYASLSSEEPLPAAAAAARRALRELGAGAPRVQLIVSVLELLNRGALLRERWRPEGWPRPSAEAAALLHGAFEIATLTRSGFVGLEHLALTLARAGAGGGGTDRTRQLLILRRDQLREHLAAYAPMPGRSPDWRGTPRLRGYASLLQPGFSPSALWRVVVDDAGAMLRELARGSSPTPSTTPEGAMFEGGPGAAARALQVIGGPEDGRILSMEPGQTLGRWSESGAAVHTLYQDSSLVDRYLSREHLRWLGEGAVELLAQGRLLVRGGERVVVNKGPLSLHLDDMLVLTRGTWLRGV